MNSDPRTPAEWQEAANLAHRWLLVDSAIQYGLLTCRTINTARCEELLKRAAELGITPEADALDRFVQAPARPKGRGRRGRKSMGAEEREEVAARMRKYWKAQRDAKGKA